ncbi:MAG TPA: Crp/Fnr family transcriptional regulator [Cyclobacteriaceae bacterium]
MIEERLKAAFDPYFKAPLEAWKVFADLCELVQYKKNEILKQKGQHEKHAHFILKGSCGIFLWKENSYVCLDLFYEGALFGDNMSFITNQPSPLESIALEDSEMLRISKQNYSKLRETPVGIRICLNTAEASFVEKQQQQIDLLLKTAEQRYIELLEKQPDIVQRTSQKHIASYLGITTQSLSRIRKNIIR